MQWVKTLDRKKLLLSLLLIAIFFAARIPNLGHETINPDAVNWHYRSEQFVVGLKHQQFMKTYQHYHPGVTLMWLTGVPIEIAKQLSGVEVYDQFSFPLFHTVAKYSLVISQLFLHILLFFALYKIMDFSKAYVFTAILILEPFFLGNSRLFHMDILFSLLIFSSISYTYLFLKEKKVLWSIIVGILCGLSFLTRSLGLGVVLFSIFGGGFFYFLETRATKPISKYLVSVFFTFALVTFVFFPALWEQPAFVLQSILSEGARVGVRSGHSQIFFNKQTENPGVLFYPMVLVLKMSPFLLIGIFMRFFSLQRSKIKDLMQGKIGFEAFSLIFYLGYLLVMSLPSKKLDRYMLVLYPFLVLVATIGFFNLKKIFRGVFFTYTVGLLYILFVVIPVISYSPYNFTYTNPIFGSAYNANKIIGQKSFGVGIYEVRDHIINNYGEDARVGFIDTKPIKSIYTNSNVSDIRVNGTSSYDILVLAINEEIPEKVIKSDVEFIKDSSLYINGLEYWRFYVKKDK